jgi:hypothetical protein
MRTLQRLLFALLISAVFVTRAAAAATYYVAPNGNDAHRGNISSPLATITRAASLARPGDTVSVRGGVYHELVRIAARGNERARITICAFTNERPIVDGAGLGEDKNVISLVGASYVALIGFEVRNATRGGICAFPASHVLIVGNVVHDCMRNGIYIGSDGNKVSVDVSVDRNEVYHTVLENRSGAMKGSWAQAIGTDSANDVRVTNNRVYENHGNGIGFCLTNNGYGHGNLLYDNFSTSFYLDNARSTIVDGNIIYSTGNRSYYRNGFPAHGIGLANETYPTHNPLQNDIITNNIVFNTRRALFYDSYDEGGGLKSIRIANNSLEGDVAVYIAPDDHGNSVIENNCFAQPQVKGARQPGMSGITFRNNSWGESGAAKRDFNHTTETDS